MSSFRILLSLAFLLTFAAPSLAADALFEFEQLVGIPTGGLTIRDIPGGGVPWAIGRSGARLDGDGRFKVEVEGLVVASSGVNPRAQFVAILSCLNADGTLNNIQTGPVDVGPAGDARIEQVLTLPATCLGPIVFVAGINPLRWFAISGF